MISEIKVTENECRAGVMEPDRLIMAIEQVRSNGYLVVKDVLSVAKVGIVHQKLSEHWQSFLKVKPAWRGGGKIIGHLGMVPPKVPEIINTEIIANPIVLSIVSGVLGDGVHITGIGGNVNFPRSKDQSFHSDLDVPTLNNMLVNIPLGQVNEQNGSIELIPGSHHPDYERSSEPVRINTASGSVLLRYPQLLHRGKQNLSNDPRFMLGLWMKTLTAEQIKLEGVCLNPESKTLLEDCVCQFERMGLGGEQSVFTPNYFNPTIPGLIKELAYCHVPSLYRILVDLLGKR